MDYYRRHRKLVLSTTLIWGAVWVLSAYTAASYPQQYLCSSFSNRCYTYPAHFDTDGFVIGLFVAVVFTFISVGATLLIVGATRWAVGKPKTA